MHKRFAAWLAAALTCASALLTPLALFTLDTASWETRNHEETVPEPVEPIRDAITAEIPVREAAPAVARARSHAQLPAA